MSKMSSICSMQILVLVAHLVIVFCNISPRFLDLPGHIILAEDSPVGTIVFNLTVMDEDGPNLNLIIPTNQQWASLITFRYKQRNSTYGLADIVLNAELDRDYSQSPRSLKFVLEDDGSNGNYVERNIPLYITDVNDEAPTFTQNRYEFSVNETAAVGTLVATVSARDPDTGLGGEVKYSMQPIGQAVSDSYKNAFQINTYGEIRVNMQLDFNVYNYYEYTLQANDSATPFNKGNATLYVKILDVQNKPPYFINLPYMVNVLENATMGSSVIQVTALDGDKGIPNSVNYSFVNGTSSIFSINSTTGVITVNSSLDCDKPDIKQKGGVYAIYVEAQEVDSSQPISQVKATTLVTITVEDINDNPPIFNSLNYEAFILENMQEGVPVTFNGTVSSMNASDIDQGQNSHFRLILKKDNQLYQDFSTLPNEVFAESAIQIRVHNSSALDYEKTKVITFQIVAEEINTAELRSTTANVTVHIQDMNDNAPIFHPDTLLAMNVSENTEIGQMLTVLKATDLDSGNFGNISYYIRGSTNTFSINQTSGIITLVGKVDREKIDHYFLTAEARDGGGLTTFGNLDVYITDENDNCPYFTRTEYYVNVREDRTEFLRGSLVLEARDDDEKWTPNSQILFRIVKASHNLTSKFYINATAGVVMLLHTIDYESLPAELQGKVILEVEAYDQGIPSLSASINITLEIEDVNDNPPNFFMPLYEVSIPESVIPGANVTSVTAIDDDSTEPNNKFLYRIDSGAGDKFRIDFQTGLITVEVGAKFDRETKSSYELNVSATDRGATPFTGYCLVNITITDVNDEPPVFHPSTFHANVMENDPISFNVVCTLATDADTNVSLSYSIVPDTIKGYDQSGKTVNITATGVYRYFTMNSTSGCIAVMNSPDRETVEVVELIAAVEDLYAINGTQQTATATVTIKIEDVNDNTPEFQPNSSYSIKVSEGLDINSEVLRLETTDKDKNQVVMYRMGNSNANNAFAVTSAGILYLNNSLDREKTPFLQVTVIATDNGNPAKSSTATINTTVQDINDNNPFFNPYTTAYNITESAIINSSIAIINAIDEDFGEFGRVLYSLNVVDDDNSLKINHTSGEIFVVKQLDRETRSSYTLYVTAIDNPNNPENQRTNQTKGITITVVDINDNSPVFTNVDNAKPFVLEDAQLSYQFFTISAEDKDIGNNAKLNYQISSNATVVNLFSIQTTQKNISGEPKYFGEILVNHSLIGFVGEHLINVTVSDQGIPVRSTCTPLFIEVVDVNLHDPEFIHPPGPLARISTKEQQPLGTPIFQIETSDDDHGKNAEISYEIQQENDFTYFKIDDKTGVLTNARSLDRELKPVYQIKIKASDHGVPASRSTVLTLNVQLLDIDDHLPNFPQSTRLQIPYKIKIEEERLGDETTTNLNIAEDLDDGNNSVICYYIIGGDLAMRNHFYLDQDGNLTLINVIDREKLEQPFINMIIWATPRCYEHIPTDLRPAVFPPTDYNYNLSLLWVQVEIQDINDNPPEFKQSVLTLGVSRDTMFGSAIANLQDLVTDADTTMKIDFMALKTEQFIKDNLQVSGDPFKVFLNGTVITNTFFPANMYGYFLIAVQAKENETDGGQFLANATLRISLINDDQRVKVVFQNRPDIVRAFQVAFTQKLQNVTGFRIVVDKIQTHENQYGYPEVNKTDMFIHGENMKTNETIPGAELLRVIDSFADALLQWRTDYKVVEIVPTTTSAQTQSLENTFKMALILVAVALSLLCVAICVVFIISRQQYKRKMRAATAQTCDSSSDLHKLELPGTNLHSYENTNPIYLEKVLLEGAGEEDDYDDDYIDSNAVEDATPDLYDEHQMSMKFPAENSNYDKMPLTIYDTGDTILNAAIKHHMNINLSNGNAVPDETAVCNGTLIENMDDNDSFSLNTDI